MRNPTGRARGDITGQDTTNKHRRRLEWRDLRTTKPATETWIPRIRAKRESPLRGAHLFEQRLLSHRGARKPDSFRWELLPRANPSTPKLPREPSSSLNTYPLSAHDLLADASHDALPTPLLPLHLLRRPAPAGPLRPLPATEQVRIDIHKLPVLILSRHGSARHLLLRE